MKLRHKRAIIATLIRAGRPDLANAAARLVTAGDHLYVGKDIWGKVAKLHIWRSAFTLEEYPPGGKIRGQRCRILHFAFHTAEESMALVNEMLDQLVAGVQVYQWDKLLAIVKMYIQKLGEYAEKVSEDEQKAVDAPNPVEHEKAPKPQQNDHGVHIEFSQPNREVTVRDTTDPKAKPMAVTKGPQAYALALKTFSEWSGLDYHSIISYWMQVGVKFRDFDLND